MTPDLNCCPEVGIEGVECPEALFNPDLKKYVKFSLYLVSLFGVFCIAGAGLHRIFSECNNINVIK
jgi:hypothetical protein